MKKTILLLAILTALTLFGCTQNPTAKTGDVIALPSPTAVLTAQPGLPTTSTTGKVWQVQISPEQFFPTSLNISVGDIVVFNNQNQYATKTVAFDDGYPNMTLRFQQRANRTFFEPGRYTYRDAVRKDQGEINVR